MASRRPRVKVAANLSIRRAPKPSTGEQLNASKVEAILSTVKDTSVEDVLPERVEETENVIEKNVCEVPEASIKQDKQDELHFKLPKPVDDGPKYSFSAGAVTDNGNTTTGNNNNEEPMSPRKQDIRAGLPLPVSRKRIRTESLTSNKSLPEGVTVNRIARKVATKQEESQRTLENKKEIRKRLLNNDNVDKQNLTMFDMIYYNPINNPMETPTLGKRGSMECIPKTEEGRRSRSVSKSRSPTPAPSPQIAPKVPIQLTPQLKVGPNGEVMLDEASLVIENEREREMREQLAKTEIVYQDEFSGNSGYYSRIRRTKDWTDKETIRFYRCLHTIGTDFSMMLTLFPCRTRRDLKLKFKKEERLNLGLVNKALQYPKAFNLEELKRRFAQEDEELERKNEERQRQAEETLEKRRQEQLQKKMMLQAAKNRNPKKRVSKSGRALIDGAEVKQEAHEASRKPKTASNRQRQKKTDVLMELENNPSTVEDVESVAQSLFDNTSTSVPAEVTSMPESSKNSSKRQKRNNTNDFRPEECHESQPSVAAMPTTRDEQVQLGLTAVTTGKQEIVQSDEQEMLANLDHDKALVYSNQPSTALIPISEGHLANCPELARWDTVKDSKSDQPNLTTNSMLNSVENHAHGKAHEASSTETATIVVNQCLPKVPDTPSSVCTESVHDITGAITAGRKHRIEGVNVNTSEEKNREPSQAQENTNEPATPVQDRSISIAASSMEVQVHQNVGFALGNDAAEAASFLTMDTESVPHLPSKEWSVSPQESVESSKQVLPEQTRKSASCNTSETRQSGYSNHTNNQGQERSVDSMVHASRESREKAIVKTRKAKKRRRRRWYQPKIQQKKICDQNAKVGQIGHRTTSDRRHGTRSMLSSAQSSPQTARRRRKKLPKGGDRLAKTTTVARSSYLDQNKHPPADGQYRGNRSDACIVFIPNENLNLIPLEPPEILAQAVPEASPVIPVESLHAQREQPVAESIITIPSSLISELTPIDIKHDGRETNLVTLPMPATTGQVVSVEGSAPAGSPNTHTELTPSATISGGQDVVQAADTTIDHTSTRVAALPPPAAGSEPFATTVRHKVEDLAEPTLALGKRIKPMIEEDEFPDANDTEDECYVADEPIPDGDDEYYNGKMEAPDADSDGYLLEPDQERRLAEEISITKEEIVAELPSNVRAVERSLGHEPQKAEGNKMESGDDEYATAKENETSGGEVGDEADAESDVGFSLEDIDINSLVLVESQDASKSSRTIYEIYVANPETGQLSEKPLDVPAAVIESIRAILEAGDGGAS